MRVRIDLLEDNYFKVFSSKFQNHLMDKLINNFLMKLN